MTKSRAGSRGNRLRYAAVSSGPMLFSATRCSKPSSNRATPLNSASHSLAAFSTIASNTGWASPCERAIRPRISLVAVCRADAASHSAVLASSSRRNSFYGLPEVNLRVVRHCFRPLPTSRRDDTLPPIALPAVRAAFREQRQGGLHPPHACCLQHFQRLVSLSPHSSTPLGGVLPSTREAGRRPARPTLFRRLSLFQALRSD